MKTRIAVAVAVLATACARSTVAGPPPPPTNTTAPASPTTTQPTALQLGQHSKMLPGITLPAGSAEAANNTPDDETWYYTVPHDLAVDIMKAQLPIGQTLMGLPFCQGLDSSHSKVSPTPVTVWEWSNGTDDFAVFVTPPRGNPPWDKQIEFRRGPWPDGEPCTGKVQVG